MIDEVMILQSTKNSDLVDMINKQIIVLSEKKKEIKNVSYTIAHYGLVYIYQALLMIGTK